MFTISTDIFDFDNEEVTAIYYQQFNSYPSKVSFRNLTSNFFKHLPVQFTTIYQNSYSKLKKQELDIFATTSINVKHKLITVREYDDFTVYYDCNNTEIVKEIIKLGNKYKRRKVKEVEDPSINLIISNHDDITTVNSTFKYTKLTEEQLAIHYGDSFSTTYKQLLEFLNQDKGLVLLHGKPGTGKSTIIKQLIADSLDKQILYLSPESISCIGNPTFTKFLLRHTNSTLLAEDAECVLMQHELRQQATTNLLNLTDGILANILNTKIIATFNTDIDKLDSALLRPGRLYLNYEFKCLSVEESNRFLNYYKVSNTVNEEKTLAELFEIVNQTK